MAINVAARPSLPMVLTRNMSAPIPPREIKMETEATIMDLVRPRSHLYRSDGLILAGPAPVTLDRDPT
jgi:hypothetical protein